MTSSPLSPNVAHAPAAEGSSTEPSVRSQDYERAILRIMVPVAVTLASGRHTLERVLELAPGALLQFSSTSSEPLTLSVGNCELAAGEAVQVGEKLGIRITSMVQPAQRA